MFEWIEALRLDTSQQQACARAVVPADSPAFADHFPRRPILPGTVMIELAAQVAGPLAEALASGDRFAFLAMVRSAKLYRPVDLPAQLLVRARLERHDGDAMTFLCDVGIGAQEVSALPDSRVATAQLTLALVSASQGWEHAVAERAQRLRRWEAAW